MIGDVPIDYGLQLASEPPEARRNAGLFRIPPVAALTPIWILSYETPRSTFPLIHLSGNSVDRCCSDSVDVRPCSPTSVGGTSTMSHGVRDRGNNDSMGVIRGSSGHSDFRPYGEVMHNSRYSRLSSVYASDIANRGNRYHPEILPNPSGNFSNNIQAGVPTAIHYLDPAAIGDGSHRRQSPPLILYKREWLMSGLSHQP
ncbi:hypothetical protein DFH09DRAFT_1069533 [Mycena vulgaris]|nr:hypothetical protein DFH09DRAFT_1069533 [Mycena vulgaris]